LKSASGTRHHRGGPELAAEAIKARDVERGLVSGEVRGTPTLFIDGALHLGGYDATTLSEVLAA